MKYGAVDGLHGGSCVENRRSVRWQNKILSLVGLAVLGVVTASVLLATVMIKTNFFFSATSNLAFQETMNNPAILFGWVKDSDSLDTATINAEEVDQLDSLLTAQDLLKKNIRVHSYSN